jgi:misacylated tRNA(Ala) deacylase
MTELLFRNDAYLTHCDATVRAVDEAGVYLDRTVCYANGGGQPGDMGRMLRADGSELAIANTVKGAGGQPAHVLAEGCEPPLVGEKVRIEIDWTRRHLHMRYHTALHLLSAVIRAPVTGGQVATDKARLDFQIDMSLLDKDRIETELNALIEAGTQVDSRWVDDAELDANPGLVKTMSVAPPRGQGKVRLIEIPGVDLQPCGGTHVRNTAEIGRVVVQKIRSEGKQNKRVIIAFADDGV